MAMPPLSWNLIFRRNLIDLEIKDLKGLITSLTRVHLSTSIPNAQAWALTSSGSFSVKSFFLNSSKLSYSVPFHPTNFIWKSKASSKVKVFAWLAAHKKVNTNDLLQLGRKPSKALSPELCILCRESGETSDHLFLHCPFTLGL